jgi:integrase
MTTGLLGVGVSFAEELSGVVTVRGVTTATVGMGSCRAQGLTLPSGERTWTVLGAGHRVVGPAEEYLEYLRAQQVSPNTVKSYARALALWWQFLELFGLVWDAVTLENFGAFLTWLRTGDEPEVVSIERRGARFAESTISARLGAVLSCYDFHVLNGVDVGRDLYRITHRGGGRYKPLLEHVARRKGRREAVIRVRRPGRAAPPILTPEQIERICEACASWDPDTRQWRGSVRNRLLWMLLAETGVRLGEALGLQHRDWHTGCGDTPFVEIDTRHHPHAVRAKNGSRRVYVSDPLARLNGDYDGQMC